MLQPWVEQLGPMGSAWTDRLLLPLDAHVSEPVSFSAHLYASSSY